MVSRTADTRTRNALLTVGLVGTGYAAKLRAEAIQSRPDATLLTVAGSDPARTQEFSQTYGAAAASSWQELVADDRVDLVVVATVNRDHGAIVRAALEANKHVVVEYPLSLVVTEAEELIALATDRNRLLHVEHIELLGGVHQALKAALPQVGTPFYARYATVNPQHPAPAKWSYQPELAGFPLVAALSRLNRLLDIFGKVAHVSCQARFQQQEMSPYYTACLCTAQLQFQTGLLAEVVYGKGETVWRSARSLEVHGTAGALFFDGDEGKLVQLQGEQPISVGARRGLFAKDTAMVLDFLQTGAPLYVTPQESLYALRVADAARRSAETGQPIAING